MININEGSRISLPQDVKGWVKSIFPKIVEKINEYNKNNHSGPTLVSSSYLKDLSGEEIQISVFVNNEIASKGKMVPYKEFPMFRDIILSPTNNKTIDQLRNSFYHEVIHAIDPFLDYRKTHGNKIRKELKKPYIERKHEFTAFSNTLFENIIYYIDDLIKNNTDPGIIKTTINDIVRGIVYSEDYDEMSDHGKGFFYDDSIIDCVMDGNYARSGNEKLKKMFLTKFYKTINEALVMVDKYKKSLRVGINEGRRTIIPDSIKSWMKKIFPSILDAIYNYDIIKKGKEIVFIDKKHTQDLSGDDIEIDVYVHPISWAHGVMQREEGEKTKRRIIMSSLSDEETSEFIWDTFVHEVIHAIDPNTSYSKKSIKHIENSEKKDYYERRHEFDAYFGAFMDSIVDRVEYFIKERVDPSEILIFLKDIKQFFLDPKFIYKKKFGFRFRFFIQEMRYRDMLHYISSSGDIKKIMLKKMVNTIEYCNQLVERYINNEHTTTLNEGRRIIIPDSIKGWMKEIFPNILKVIKDYDAMKKNEELGVFIGGINTKDLSGDDIEIIVYVKPLDAYGDKIRYYSKKHIRHIRISTDDISEENIWDTFLHEIIHSIDPNLSLSKKTSNYFVSSSKKDYFDRREEFDAFFNSFIDQVVEQVKLFIKENKNTDDITKFLLDIKLFFLRHRYIEDGGFGIDFANFTLPRLNSGIRHYINLKDNDIKKVMFKKLINTIKYCEDLIKKNKEKIDDEEWDKDKKNAISSNPLFSFARNKLSGLNSIKEIRGMIRREIILLENSPVTEVQNFSLEEIRKIANKKGIRTEGDYIFLYHGTSPKNHKRIISTGRYNAGSFFSEDIETARKYGSMAISSGQPIVEMVVIFMGSLYYNGYFSLNEDVFLKHGLYNPKNLKGRKINSKKNEALYSAVVLDDESRKHLIYNLKSQGYSIPERWETITDHMTIALGDQLEHMGLKDMVGEEIELTATYIGCNDNAMAVIVDGFKSKNNIPHITIATNTSNSATPKMSKDIKEWKKLNNKIIIKGVVKEIF